ncbi:MAG: carbonic anhydrase [Gemmataceae bacterium]
MRFRQLQPLPILAGVLIVSLGAAFFGTRVGRDSLVDSPTPTSADSALAELRAGNSRYASSHRTRSNDTRHDAELRRRLAAGQHPFAAILCCSDSRLCPAFIFDQHPGSIFEIRNAGNVVEDDALASLEYAVEHLHVPFVLVLGHKGCGAIEAVFEAGDRPLHDNLRDLQERMKGIRPRVLASNRKSTPDALNALAKDNAQEQAKTLLKESEPISAAVSRKEVRLMFGMYDMETGEVEYFDLP